MTNLMEVPTKVYQVVKYFKDECNRVTKDGKVAYLYNSREMLDKLDTSITQYTYVLKWLKHLNMGTIIAGRSGPSSFVVTGDLGQVQENKELSLAPAFITKASTNGTRKYHKKEVEPPVNSLTSKLKARLTAIDEEVAAKMAEIKALKTKRKTVKFVSKNLDQYTQLLEIIEDIKL